MEARRWCSSGVASPPSGSARTHTQHKLEPALRACTLLWAWGGLDGQLPPERSPAEPPPRRASLLKLPPGTTPRALTVVLGVIYRGCVEGGESGEVRQVDASQQRPPLHLGRHETVDAASQGGREGGRGRPKGGASRRSTATRCIGCFDFVSVKCSGQRRPPRSQERHVGAMGHTVDIKPQRDLLPPAGGGREASKAD